jgi:hypothetical protein
VHSLPTEKQDTNNNITARISQEHPHLLEGTIFRQRESARHKNPDTKIVTSNMFDENAIKVEVHSCAELDQT